MKYTIEGFSQHKLVEFGLDSIDALILRWYVDFLPKMSSTIHDGVEYRWVKYQAVIDDLPILGINNKNNIARRFDKFVNCSIMNKFVNKKGGNYTNFRLADKYLELIEVSTQKDIPIYSKVDTYLLKSRDPIYSKVDTKDSSINNSFTNSSINIIIDYFNDQTGKNKYKSGSDLSTLKKYINEMIKSGDSIDNIKILIDYKLANPNTKNIDLLSWLNTKYAGQNISMALDWHNSGRKLILDFNKLKKIEGVFKQEDYTNDKVIKVIGFAPNQDTNKF